MCDLLWAFMEIISIYGPFCDSLVLRLLCIQPSEILFKSNKQMMNHHHNQGRWLGNKRLLLDWAPPPLQSVFVALKTGNTVFLSIWTWNGDELEMSDRRCRCTCETSVLGSRVTCWQRAFLMSETAGGQLFFFLLKVFRDVVLHVITTAAAPRIPISWLNKYLKKNKSGKWWRSFCSPGFTPDLKNNGVLLNEGQ